MTNQEIYELLERFERSSIQHMRLNRGDFALEVSKASAAPAAITPAVQTAPAAVSPVPAAALDKAITAPLAGVFYAAPSPGAEPFVRAGDRVKQGDTVCLMEAMKMISEIPAPCDCIITEIVKENGELAAFDEALLRYRPC